MNRIEHTAFPTVTMTGFARMLPPAAFDIVLPLALVEIDRRRAALGFGPVRLLTLGPLYLTDKATGESTAEVFMVEYEATCETIEPARGG